MRLIGLAVAIFFMGVLFLLAAKPITEMMGIKFPEVFGFTPIDTSTTSGGFGGPVQNPFPIEEAFVPGITGAGNPHQPSEVACVISKKIFDDYLIYGNGDRDAGEGKNCFDNQCIINAGSFRLANVDGTDWENVLSGASNPYGPCHLCREPPSAGGTIIPDLDEVCINLNLKDKETGNTKICDSPFTSYSGEQVKFGNNNCFCPDSNKNAKADWCNIRCDGGNNDLDGSDFCDGSTTSDPKNLILWIGKGRGTDTDEWRVSDDIYYNLDGNSVTLSKQPDQYLYGIIWDKSYSHNRYKVIFVRTPLQSSSDSFNFLWNNDGFKNYKRTNPLGVWYGEAREIARVMVNPAVATGIGDLAGDAGLKSVIDGSEKKVWCESCSNKDECLATEPTTVDETYSFNFGSKPIKIQVDSRVDCNGGILKSGSQYIVSVKNWYQDYLTLGRMMYQNKFKKYDRTVSIWCESPGPNGC